MPRPDTLPDEISTTLGDQNMRLSAAGLRANLTGWSGGCFVCGAGLAGRLPLSLMGVGRARPTTPEADGPEITALTRPAVDTCQTCSGSSCRNGCSLPHVLS